MMGWGNQGHGMWGMGGVGGMIMMIFFWAIIIIGAILIIRYFTAGHVGISGGQGTGPIPGVRDPLEILRERYAKGEIDTEEFEERKRVLEGEG
jgi:putative membrane protein